MGNKDDILEYIWLYCHDFKTKEEKLANRHFFGQEKFLKFKDRSKKANELYNEFTTEDEEALKLYYLGFEEFKKRVCERIYEAHLNKIDFNRCPKCNEVARTPEAKQCRYCRHNWH